MKEWLAGGSGEVLCVHIAAGSNQVDNPISKNFIQSLFKLMRLSFIICAVKPTGL